MAKRYEESFKEEIVKQYQSGNSAVELCAKFKFVDIIIPLHLLM